MPLSNRVATRYNSFQAPLDQLWESILRSKILSNLSHARSFCLHRSNSPPRLHNFYFHNTLKRNAHFQPGCNALQLVPTPLDQLWASILSCRTQSSLSHARSFCLHRSNSPLCFPNYDFHRPLERNACFQPGCNSLQLLWTSSGNQFCLVKHNQIDYMRAAAACIVPTRSYAFPTMFSQHSQTECLFTTHTPFRLLKL